MLTIWIGTVLKRRAIVFLILFGSCGTALAQQVSLSLVRPESIEPASFVKSVEPATLPEASSHRFWDRENSLLFATSAAFSTADFFVTRNSLRNGAHELNPVTRVFAGSTAGLAVNFAGETASVVGLSYLFHKTRHRKLERAVSLVNIGASVAAVTFDLAPH